MKTSDCAGGLVCSEGLCTTSAEASGTGAQGDAQGLAGMLSQGGAAAPLAWARTVPGLVMGSPDLALGPRGELVVHVTSERLPHVYGQLVIDDWLMRFDGATGEMLWIEKVGSGVSMAIDSMGSIVLAWPTLLQKLDSSGSLIWSIPRAARGAYETSQVAVDSNADIVVARTELDVSPSEIGAEPKGYLELEKMDTHGTPLWTHQFGDSTSLLDGAFIAVDSSNSVVFLASRVEGAIDFGGGPLTGSNVLAKYDAEGKHVFSKALGGFAQTVYQSSSPVVTDRVGNIFVRDEVSGPVDIGLGPLECGRQIVLKFAPSGAPLWNKCLVVHDLAVLPDGGFMTSAKLSVASTVGDQLYAPVDEYDGLLARYDAAGAWAKTFCTLQPGRQVFGDVTPDASGALVLVGVFDSQLTLPGEMSLAPVAENVWTTFVARVTPWN